MTLLIKNVQLIDGAGRPPVKADVLLKNEKISAVGSFPKYKADDTIDGMGAYCAPGFIDVNTSSDRYLTLFSNPSQKDFLLQGVTTIIGGTNGLSLAPLLYGSLESIYEYADINKININWHTFGEFVKIFEQKSFGVNFGTFIGCATIKQALIGKETRELSANELKIFDSLAEKSSKEGSFGLSVDLSSDYGAKTAENEIKNIVEFAAKSKGVCSVNLRKGKNKLLFSMNEMINLAKETGAKIFINRFLPTTETSGDYERALNLINENADKADVYFNIYPFNTRIVPLRDFLKDGEESSGPEEKNIKDAEQLKGKEIVVLSAPRNEYLVGKSLKEFADNRNLTITKAMLALMKLTGLRASVFYKDADINQIIKTLPNDRAIIASDSASFENSEKKIVLPENNIRTFPRLLELAEKENILPLEKAIYKITGLPAQKLNIGSRGLIRDGYFADLVIFRDAEIKEVIVNGKRAVKDGQFQNILAGKMILRA
jgi:N-acyl-D-amino-acid deacylase